MVENILFPIEFKSMIIYFADVCQQIWCCQVDKKAITVQSNSSDGVRKVARLRPNRSLHLSPVQQA